ncbi:M12 family metallopeptidase [Niveispirillum sp. KHB5.9]|uniref:M12 family metallopeptidase n=1 Tax=Niveispirillum sp. KHB5.9 TaxID=3400269 RepID=UPI003A890CB8
MTQDPAVVHDHRNCFCSVLADPGFQPVHAQNLTERAVLLNNAFWGRGVRLRVAFMQGDGALHHRVAELAQAWPRETGANFSFEFWIDSGHDPADADIRVSFEPDKGSFSHLGRYAQAVDRRERTMNLGWMSTSLPEDEARAVVLHEFGHALGLLHEHMNPARPIDWNRGRVRADLRASQGWGDDVIDANMFSRYDPGQVFGTDVDPASIMMYPIPPEWTRDGFTVGFNTKLSPIDIALVQRAYGRRPIFGG